MIAKRFAAKFSTLPKWASVDPFTLGGKHPHTVVNFLNGKEFKSGKNLLPIVDPMNGEHFINVDLVDSSETQGFVDSQKSTPRFGLHNPIRNVHRYTMYGDIYFRIAEEMRKKETETFFTKLIQRTMPKSWAQCLGQWIVTRKFFQNFAGDNPRFLVKSFNVSGDHDGQTSSGYRWPYGNVCVIAPFNFPIEIPCLQLFGALLVGNKPLLKCDNKMAICLQQFLLMAKHCGLPLEDLNFINCTNEVMTKVIDEADFKLVQFTGSSSVAQKISHQVQGKIRIEDAGFDWKVLGPDVANMDYVAWTADQDAYAASGQKCSAQSIVFVHNNWIKAGYLAKIQTLAARRKIQDLTVGPVLTWNNKKIKAHLSSITALPGSKLLFGGNPLKNHSIPDIYGSYEPTAVQVDIETVLSNYDLCTTELFGPFQVIVPYSDEQLPKVLQALSKMKNNLTAGLVSNDPVFLDKVLGQTINGTTYAGLRARTTGAPQNHWFGPCGDPRGAGIGTKEAILHVWTSHREIIRDYGPIDPNWKTPNAT